MARDRYKIYDEEYPYLITSGIRYGFPVFAIPAATQIVLESLTYLQEKKDVRLIAYVIMENHVHLIVQGVSLAMKLGGFKSYCARGIIDFLFENGHTNVLKRLKRVKKPQKTDRRYQFWEEGFHPKQIAGDDMMIQKIEYIHNNPVKRGYVDEPEHWRYSSARDYAGGEGLIPVTLFRGRG